MFTENSLRNALLVAPGLSDLESMHLAAALYDLNDGFGPREPEPAPATVHQGESTMTRLLSPLRHVAVPAAIFATFFALPIYSYLAITA